MQNRPDGSGMVAHVGTTPCVLPVAQAATIRTNSRTSQHSERTTVLSK